MALKLDSYFATHANALAVRGRRAELLANNLANADTPGYKARDIDFAAAMKAVAAGSAPAAPTPRAPSMPGQSQDVLAPYIKYRLPAQPTLDGNSVDIDAERAAFADNAVHYQASLTFLNGRIKSLMLALTGQ